VCFTILSLKRFRREEEEVEIASPQKSSSGKKKPSGGSMRSRTFSTESNSSMASDSDDEARQTKPSKVVSIFDDFDMEERPVVSRTEECVKETQNGNHDAAEVLSSFFAGKQYDKLSIVRKPPIEIPTSSPTTTTPTSESKRFTKLSQKERKRLSLMGHSTKPVDDKEGSPEGMSNFLIA